MQLKSNASQTFHVQYHIKLISNGYALLEDVKEGTKSTVKGLDSRFPIIIHRVFSHFLMLDRIQINMHAGAPQNKSETVGVTPILRVAK